MFQNKYTSGLSLHEFYKSLCTRGLSDSRRNSTPEKDHVSKQYTYMYQLHTLTDAENVDLTEGVSVDGNKALLCTGKPRQYRYGLHFPRRKNTQQYNE